MLHIGLGVWLLIKMVVLQGMGRPRLFKGAGLVVVQMLGLALRVARASLGSTESTATISTTKRRLRPLLLLLLLLHLLVLLPPAPAPAPMVKQIRHYTSRQK